MKKLLLGLGTIAAVTAPVVSVVACGTVKKFTKGNIVPFDDGGIKNIKSSIRTLDISKKDFIGDFRNRDDKKIFNASNGIINPSQFSDEGNINQISLPNIEEIGDKAFYKSPLSSVSLPAIKRIGIKTFASATLRTLSLPVAKEIGRWAFRDSLLKTLFLPNVEKLGDAFVGLVNSPSTTVVLPEKFNTQSEISRIFMGVTNKVSFIWIAPDKSRYSNMAKMSDAKIVFDNEFEGGFSKFPYRAKEFKGTGNEVREMEFEGEKDLTSVSMPGVEKIGERAFNGCISLANIELPAVKTIDERAFFGIAIKTLELQKVENIGKFAFQYVSSLKSVFLPSVKTIGDEAFESSNLTSLSLPNVYSVGEGAFKDSLLSSLSLPEVKYIGAEAFGWSRLTSLCIPKATTIGDKSLRVINDPSTIVTIPNKFNGRERYRIFDGAFDKVTFKYV